MTYEVQQTRWDRIIRRVSGSIGPGSRVSETLSELFPVLDVERVPAELLVLGGTGICHGGSTLTGAAGESAKAQLFNPADSNIIATLTKVIFAVTTASIARWGFSAASFGTAVGTQRFTDQRRPLPALPVCEVRQLSEAALANATAQTRVVSATTLQLENENGLAVLSPGTGFEIGEDTVASTIFFTFYWRERPAEESELNL